MTAEFAVDQAAPALVNAVSVETPHGLRTFELCSGDILATPTNLLVISTHHNLEKSPTGQLVSNLKKRFDFKVDVDKPWISFGEGITACIQEGRKEGPFQFLLTMRIARSRSQQDPVKFYDQAIRATFASAAALEFLGQSFRTVSLPVLSGQRIVDYAAAVQSLLRYALAWLRQSRHTEVIRYYIFDPQGLQTWDSAMNISLGRSYVDGANQFVVRSLCQEIVSKIDSGRFTGTLAELTSTLRRALAEPERICLQSVATFGRKLAEVVTEHLCKSLDLQVHRELTNNIEQVRSAKMVADWIISYLHSLRVFGNEGVHSLAAKRSVVPSQLSPEDLVSILCAIRATLSFFLIWQSR